MCALLDSITGDPGGNVQLSESLIRHAYCRRKSYSLRIFHLLLSFLFNRESSLHLDGRGQILSASFSSGFWVVFGGMDSISKEADRPYLHNSCIQLSPIQSLDQDGEGVKETNDELAAPYNVVDETSVIPKAHDQKGDCHGGMNAPSPTSYLMGRGRVRIRALSRSRLFDRRLPWIGRG